MDSSPTRLAIVGQCYVGLPLATLVYDMTEAAVGESNAGRMPFAEPGAAEVLRRVLTVGDLKASADTAILGRAWSTPGLRSPLEHSCACTRGTRRISSVHGLGLPIVHRHGRSKPQNWARGPADVTNLRC